MKTLKRSLLISALILFAGINNVFSFGNESNESNEKPYLFRSERPRTYTSKKPVLIMNTDEFSQANTEAESTSKVDIPSDSPLKHLLPYDLYKYDTTSCNPDHRCYDIRKPLNKKFTFLFNFMSLQQYTANQLPY